MKRISKFPIMLIILLIISLGFNIAGAVAENTPEPGSEQDPLVSKAYVDGVAANYLAEIAKLNEQVTALKAQVEASNAKVEEFKLQLQSSPSGAQAFIYVTLEKGQQLLPGAGTELILVGGKATSVPGKDGGAILDITSAKALTKGSSIVLNHMLVSAKDDGRGVKASVKSTVIVKGLYKTSGNTSVDTKPGDDTSTNTNTDPDSGTKPDSNSNTGTKAIKGKVNVQTLNVRSEPSTSAKIVAKLTSGKIIEILSTKGEWYKIKTAEGTIGWSISRSIIKQ